MKNLLYIPDGARLVEFNLQEVLRVQNAREQHLLLERLFSSQIEPLIKKTVRVKFSSIHATGQDEEDVCSEASLRLWKQLQKWMQTPDAVNVTDFPAYVAATTLNCCKEYFRNRFPRRWHLRNRLRYLFTHSNQFTMWKSETGAWLCAFSDWAQQPQIKPDQLKQLMENPDVIRTGAAKGKSISDLATIVLRIANAPLGLDDLLYVLLRLPGVREEFQDIQMDHEREVNDLADPESTVKFASQKQTYLGQLWKEICSLPINQRIALLLNLRDREGRDAITSFPATGTASIPQIAEAMNMAAEELAAMWNDLPLDDARIAQRLQLSRQQVINLRKAARERLAYRINRQSGVI